MHKVSCWLSWIKGVCGWLFCEIQPSQQWSSAETSSSINDKAISTNVTVPAMHFHNVCPDFAPLSVFAAGTWHSNASLPAVTTISPSRRVNSDCYVNCTGLKQKQTIKLAMLYSSATQLWQKRKIQRICKPLPIKILPSNGHRCRCPFNFVAIIFLHLFFDVNVVADLFSRLHNQWHPDKRGAHNFTCKYACVLYHRKMMNELHTQKSWFKDVPKFYIFTITNIASFTIIILIIIIIIIIITGTLLRLWCCPSSPILGQTLSIVSCLSIAYTFIIIIIIIIISSTARCIFEYQ